MCHYPKGIHKSDFPNVEPVLNPHLKSTLFGFRIKERDMSLFFSHIVDLKSAVEESCEGNYDTDFPFKGMGCRMQLVFDAELVADCASNSVPKTVV